MDNQRIKPFEQNHSYWQYREQPLLLLGGSDEDNLFQCRLSAKDPIAHNRRGDDLDSISDTLNLEYQLNTLKDIGGNFVRCTMSSRDIGNVWPYAVDEKSGKFDLDTFNEEYWMRFERFLGMTHEREIIVQVELWATYDFYQREIRPAVFPWHLNPFNPRNNINYTSEESGLPEDFPSRGCSVVNPFFETVPSLNNNSRLIAYQHAYVNRLLSISFGFDHVLYCIDNETNAHPDWAMYWAEYLRNQADTAGVEIEITEMWDTFDPTNGAVEGAIRQPLETNPFVYRSSPLNCLQHSDFFSFSDISNHNAQLGETHYQTGQWFWKKIQSSNSVWPVHCDKMYGGDSGFDFAGTRKDGLERFWRNIFAGFAGCRFHRPPAGLGLNDDARTHIRAMRMLTDELNIFACRPCPELLSMREDNTSYCMADPGHTYAVVFVQPGSCVLDVSAMGDRPRKVRWLNIEYLRWGNPEPCQRLAWLNLSTPDSGYSVALVDEEA